MRGKPFIKIMYPEASEAAMLLTEAMIRRSSGKRIVETTSEERESSGDLLFADACGHNTDTSVELQLNLAPEAMDFALATLIGRNLTEEEKRAVRMATDSTEVVDLLSSRAQAAQAPGQALDGDSSADVPSAEREAATQSVEQEEKIEIGKISDKELRNILTDMIVSMDEGTETTDAIDTAIAEVKKRAGGLQGRIEEDAGLADSLAVLICGAQRVQPKKTTDLRLFANDLARNLHESFDSEAIYVVTASELDRVVSDVQRNFTEHPGRTLAAELVERAKARAKKELTWDDVAAEARKIGQRGASEPTDDGVEDDGEIDAGLLDDVEDGCAPAGEVIGHDE